MKSGDQNMHMRSNSESRAGAITDAGQSDATITEPSSIVGSAGISPNISRGQISAKSSVG